MKSVHAFTPICNSFSITPQQRPPRASSRGILQRAARRAARARRRSSVRRYMPSTSQGGERSACSASRRLSPVSPGQERPASRLARRSAKFTIRLRVLRQSAAVQESPASSETYRRMRSSAAKVQTAPAKHAPSTNSCSLTYRAHVEHAMRFMVAISSRQAAAASARPSSGKPPPSVFA